MSKQHIYLAYFLITGLLFLSPSVGQSQISYPKTIQAGATWTISIGQGMDSFQEFQVQVSCDTQQIRGLIYHAVQVEPPAGNLPQNCGVGGWVREDTLAQQVYFIPLGADEERLIIDYTLSVGDTFNFPSPLGKQVVQEIREINYFGQSTSFIDFGALANQGFIKGFGSTTTAILPECGGFNRVVDYEIQDFACQITTTTESLIPASSIKLNPNPAKDFFTIELFNELRAAPVLLELRSPQGQLLLRKILDQNSNTIPLYSFPKGLLVLHFRQGHHYLSKKLLHL
jgi:hypothetical protein